MFDSRAARLQQQAMEALSDLRTWIWGQHAALLPDDLASITREQAERFAAYLDWYSRVEEVILALAAAAEAAVAALAVAPQPAPRPAPAAPSEQVAAPATREEQLAAPTVRPTSSQGASERSNGWPPVITVPGPLLATGFKAA